MIAENSNDTVSRLFGIEFDATWINPFEDSYIYLGDFYNEAGWPIARFGSIIGMPHTQCPEQAMLIWSFLRQYSRDLKTGALRFDKAEVGGANK